jgi:uncharacterized SAM-binding protein YcdF (DUF218 family)
MKHRLSAAVILSVIVYILSAAARIYLYSTISVNQDADAAVVLGASAWNSTPSPVFRERINHAVWLYKQGFVKFLIFTGGKGKGAELAESTVAKKYAISQSVQPEDILTETMSHTTFGNFYYILPIIKSRHFNSLLIVSDPMHMLRSMAIARHFQLKALPSPTPTTRYVSLKTNLQFLSYETFFYCLQEIYFNLKEIISFIIVMAILILAYSRHFQLFSLI